MAREKIKISKIENTAARQVTFSKRQRGLFKKAQELAILCGVDVGVIVFCSKGKFYDFASISMKDIIEKYRMDPSNGLFNPHQLSPEMQLENAEQKSLENKTMEMTLEPRHFKGEDIEELTKAKLVQLEEALGKGLRCVLNKKGEKLMEENKLLRQQVMELTKGREQVALSEPVRISYDGKQSSVSVATASDSKNNRDFADSSGASHKLGLGQNN